MRFLFSLGIFMVKENIRIQLETQRENGEKVSVQDPFAAAFLELPMCFFFS